MQGQSDYTETKERLLAAVLKPTFAAIARNVKRPAFYIDCHAGCGQNDVACAVAPITGSPVVAWHAAHSVNAKHVAFVLMERDGRAIEQLKQHLPHAKVWPGDNAVGLRILMRSLPKNAWGAIFVDPNGYFRRNKDGSGVPVTELIEFCQAFPAFDVILNLNVRVLKLMRGHKRSEAFHGLMAPHEVLAALRRQHWSVAYCARNADSFLFACGRNWKCKGGVGGMVDANSPAGQAILRHLAGDKSADVAPIKLRRTQGDLFLRISKKRGDDDAAPAADAA